MLIVLELVKISGMGYASVVCLVGKRSTFSKYTESAMVHRPWVADDFLTFFSLQSSGAPVQVMAVRIELPEFIT